MDIGTLLTISVTDPKTGVSTKYRSKIVEKNEHYLFIDYPVNVETKRTAILPKATHVQTSYIDSDQSVYSFNTKIVARVNVNIPALAVSTPKETDIKRIQRRSFVRIDTAVDVSIHHTDDIIEPFTTVTSDISGGGMSIILPTNNMLNENDSVDLWIVLQMQNGEFQYIYSQSKVVRVFTDKTTINTASIKFETISKLDQQAVIRYCFEKQRELRSKKIM